MHMRLAFAVAAHLEPEILIIDEVLAVGDMRYQNKCLGKMGDVASQGRTVLIVSHQIASIASLCTSAIWLDCGRIAAAGDVRRTIEAYVESCRGNERGGDPGKWKRRGTGEARFLDIQLMDVNENPSAVFRMGDTLIVRFEAEFRRRFPHVDMSLEIRRTDTRLPVLHLTNDDCGDELTYLPEGMHAFRVGIPDCPLYPGNYTLSAWIGSNGSAYDYVEDVAGFLVSEGQVSRRAQPFWPHLGTVYQPSTWEEIPETPSQ
jgi:lipopolysaccharide transport system ATP-binding protein